MGSGDWNPEQYHRFAAERAQPFWDLVGLIEAEPSIERAVDLGCGAGDLTAAFSDRAAIGDMTGIDSSPAMLERAAAHERDGLRFESGDIGAWEEPGGYDLVLANASLHWVPDHPAVLGRWAASLRPGGQLAVQVPTNADHPSHTSAAEIGWTEPFLSAMAGAPPPDPTAANILPPERYATVLHDLGVADQHVRLQVYTHLLASTDEVVEWVKGSSLTRFFAALPAELHDPFEAAYRVRLHERLGTHSPFLFTFKRIVMWARMPG